MLCISEVKKGSEKGKLLKNLTSIFLKLSLFIGIYSSRNM